MLFEVVIKSKVSIETLSTSISKLVLCAGLLLAGFSSPGHAAEISNPGFENDWEAWIEIDKNNRSAAISGDSREGKNSAKLTSTSGSFGQVIYVDPNTPEDGGDGRSKRIAECELVQGYENKDYFYTGEDGGMVFRATLAVNHVTTTGDARDIGRVIIGQIHASSDEPIRLHYRKLPHNERGSIYAAHEISGGDDQWYSSWEVSLIRQPIRLMV